MIYDIVEGTSSNLQFQLFENGVPINLTGIAVTLLLSDRTGAAVSNPGAVTVVNATTGTVQLAPTNASVFVQTKGPYLARWVLTDGTGDVGYVPTTDRDIWNIVGQ